MDFANYLSLAYRQNLAMFRTSGAFGDVASYNLAIAHDNLAVNHHNDSLTS